MAMLVITRWYHNHLSELAKVQTKAGSLAAWPKNRGIMGYGSKQHFRTLYYFAIWSSVFAYSFHMSRCEWFLLPYLEDPPTKALNSHG